MASKKGIAHWLLKLAVVITYCFIMIPGEHVGGPLLFFILFGLGDGSALALLCALVLLTLLSILISTMIQNRSYDRILLPAGLIVLSVPVIGFTLQILEHSRFGVIFFTTAALFILLMTMALYFTFRRDRMAKNAGSFSKSDLDPSEPKSKEKSE